MSIGTYVKAFKHKGKVQLGPVATGYVSAATKEEVDGKLVPATADFRSYKNMTDSFTDHGLFISKNKHYDAALAAYATTGDSDAFALALQTNHYATASDYAILLIGIMTRRNLYQYNLKKPTTKTTPANHR